MTWSHFSRSYRMASSRTPDLYTRDVGFEVIQVLGLCSKWTGNSTRMSLAVRLGIPDLRYIGTLGWPDKHMESGHIRWPNQWFWRLRPTTRSLGHRFRGPDLYIEVWIWWSRTMKSMISRVDTPKMTTFGTLFGPLFGRSNPRVPCSGGCVSGSSNPGPLNPPYYPLWPKGSHEPWFPGSKRGGQFVGVWSSPS